MEKSRANLIVASAAFVLGWAFNSYHTKKKLAPILNSQQQSIYQLERRARVHKNLTDLWRWQHEDHESLRRLTGFENTAPLDTDFEY